MVAETGNLVKVRFGSMPNFRLVDPNVDDDGSEEKPAKLYRSSRPDFLEHSEVSQFTSLGIKTIIDFRSSTEYKKSQGNKLLDSQYKVYALRFPYSLAYKPNEKIQLKSVKLKGVNSTGEEKDENIQPERKHILIDFFKRNYIWAVFTRAPWYIQLYSIFWLLLDIIFYTGFRWFVGVFAKKVLNPAGLGGQYIDMINHSQASICASLKILSDPNNLPAMINCAHGKDRTGIISALIQALMGRSKEYIGSQYSRSETELAPVKDRVYEDIVKQFQMCESFTLAKAENITNMLGHVEKMWGSVSNYLEAIGFGSEEQERLKKNLVGTPL